jgi:hypothetical protein
MDFLTAIKNRIASLFCREVLFGLIMLGVASVALFTGHMTAVEFITAGGIGGGMSTAGILIGKATGGVQPPTPPPG